MRKTLLFALTLLALFGFSPFSLSAQAQTNLSIYADGLGSGWQNWSWGSNLNFDNTAPVHSGAKSLSVSYSGGYGGLYLSYPSKLDTRAYSALTFYIHGGSVNGRSIEVKAVRNGSFVNGVMIGPSNIEGGSVAAGTWRKVTLPLSVLGASGVLDLSGFCFQNSTGGDQPAFYVDDIELTSIAPPSVVHVAVSPTQVIRSVDPRTIGISTVVWDPFVDSAASVNLLTEAGNRTLRFPGGSISDGYHWRTGTNDGSNYVWVTNFDNFARTARLTGASVYLTANYGTGTPQEAADWVTYSNITKGYGFKYWEIGNENYGSWEADNNTRPHDPYTYAVRVKDYYQRMKAVDPTLKIGVVCVNGEDGWVNYTDHPATNPRTGTAHNGWTPVMLATLKSLGVTPDFLVLHVYPQQPGNETDAGLLTASTSWKEDAADLRQMLTDYLGAAGAGVEIVCTENNSVTFNPGKQTTSLVNALFYCDSLGSLLQTEFNSLIWWNLRNAQQSGYNNSASLYGWRNYGDYGMISPANERYPAFYGMKLMSGFAQPGDSVVSVTSDYSLLTVYAIVQREQVMKLLVINKSPVKTLTARIDLGGAIPRGGLSVTSYGIPQDEAARTGVGSPDLAQTTAPVARSLQRSFAPYSATLLTLPVTIRKIR